MLGEQIRSVRMANGISQVEFANILNVSKQSVSNWEHSNIMPSVDILRDIAIKFDVSADFLLELDKRINLNIEGLPIEFIIHLQQIILDFKKVYKKEAASSGSKNSDL